MLGEQVMARGFAAMAEQGDSPTPRAVFEAIVEAGLPGDDARRTDSLLFFSFYVAAITDPALSSKEALTAPHWVVAFATELIEQAQQSGMTRDGLDARLEARMLMSSFYWLSLAVLAGNETIEDARTTIEYQLDRIFVSV